MIGVGVCCLDILVRALGSLLEAFHAQFLLFLDVRTVNDPGEFVCIVSSREAHLIPAINNVFSQWAYWEHIVGTCTPYDRHELNNTVSRGGMTRI